MKNLVEAILIIALMFNSSQALAHGGCCHPHTVPTNINCSKDADTGKPVDTSQEESCLDKKAALEKKRQQEKLRRTCLNEAEKTNGHTSMWQHLRHGLSLIHDPQVEEMKVLCRDMTTEYLSQDTKKHSLLAQECGEQIKKEAEKTPDNTEHFQKLQAICEQMTGQKIDIKYDNSSGNLK